MNANHQNDIVVPPQSLSAIPIVAPPSEDIASAPTSPTKVNSKPPSKVTPASAKRLCRNVIIHGFCKYEGKGCEFNHDSKTNGRQDIYPHTKVFAHKSEYLADQYHFICHSRKYNPVSIRSATPPVSMSTSNVEPSNQEPTQDVAALSNSFAQFDLGGHPIPPPPPSGFQHPIDMMNMMPPGPMDPYFMMHAGFPRQPSFFIPDNLREQLTRRNESMLATVPGHDLPQEVHVYHSLCPLEDKPGQCFGHPSWIYKAMSSTDGQIYALVRIEGFRLVNEMAMSVVESWRHIRHCNIVSVREAFTTRAFGDSSLIFVFDFHPCAMTLYHAHFSPAAQAAYGQNMMIPETTLWSYITQITSALKAVHSSGLAARNIEPSKILVTGKHRLRLNCASIMDVIQFDGGQQVTRYQQEDLLSFGKLIIALACNSMQSFHNLPQSFEYISRYYSPDVKNLILYLLSKPMPTKSIDEVISLIGPRSLHDINCSQLYTDALEHELSKELENGRIVRLMCKLGFINERPEFDMDPRWSETGDRYIIKLFRDYVFHQVDESGVPVVDMAHVLSCLNKLDAGVDEKIMLMSRDEQSCLIVSYKEIKNCIAAAFNDISSGRK
ncbi:hypothetical protein DM01DRAFT_1347129 [Hesseltinella vesiculosa]|uniref:PAN2-PAN3 deadenylation complex subunit PAN3 n=1 Tax=Hesseltinella vesiculosa TaxID=101127 RepID=A0A1X2GDK9_9FUNG|nr:hypothetical protein DM01DRAFT_1347129 [Hesseltinella vesiculosa]